MKKLQFLLLYLFSLLLTPAVAESIKGRVGVRAKPNGPVLFMLNDGMEVDCGIPENGWYQILITVKSNKQQYNGQRVKKGQKLYNADNELISVMLADMPDDITTQEAYGVDKDAEYYLEIRAFIKQSDIKPESIPENALAQILTSKAAHLQLDTLKGFLKQNGYEETTLLQRTLPKLKEYYIYESLVIDESPGYRIGLFLKAIS